MKQNSYASSDVNVPRQSDFRPRLWTQDLESLLQLSSHFAVEDLINPPSATEITEGIHIILVDEETSEAAVRRAIYLIRTAGSEPEVRQMRSSVRESLQGLSSKEVFTSLIDYALPWEKWLEFRSSQLVTVRIAKDVAAVILKYSQFPEMELEELRQRCKVSGQQWERIITKLESQSSKYKAAKIRLEILNWLRITDPILQEIERQRILSTYHIRGDAFKRLCHAQRADENRSALNKRFISLEEFFKLEESNVVDFLVDGYCLRKTSGVLSGLPGTGKTIAAMQLAHAVATGGEFLGERCKQAPVLFISMDQPSNITLRYLMNITGGVERLSNFYLVTETQQTGGWNIKDLELLEKWLEEIKPGLVIIDSIRTTVCYPLGIEEKSEMIGHWLKEVERLVTRYGSLLWIHHDNKDRDKSGVARASGSTAIVGNVSFHWRLERASKDDSDPNRVLTMPKTRGFEPVSVNLKFNPETSCFDFLGLFGESEEVANERQTYQRKVIELLSSKPGTGFEVSEIKEYVGCGDYIYVLLSRMVARGITGRRQSTTNPKAKVYYVLADTLQDMKSSPITSSILSDDKLSFTPENAVIDVRIDEMIGDRNHYQQDVSSSSIISSITQGGGRVNEREPSPPPHIRGFDSSTPETKTGQEILSSITSSITPEEEKTVIDNSNELAETPVHSVLDHPPIPYAVGSKVEFWHDVEQQWLEGQVVDLYQERGIFIKAVICYWAWNKQRRTNINRLDWLRA